MCKRSVPCLFTSGSDMGIKGSDAEGFLFEPVVGGACPRCLKSGRIPKGRTILTPRRIEGTVWHPAPRSRAWTRALRGVRVSTLFPAHAKAASHHPCGLDIGFANPFRRPVRSFPRIAGVLLPHPLVSKPCNCRKSIMPFFLYLSPIVLLPTTSILLRMGKMMKNTCTSGRRILAGSSDRTSFFK